ncbi:unnamed protein product, partial [Symbiodinium necroappetens]
MSIVDLPLTSLGALEVQSVSFSDEDSVATYVKGEVTWTRQDNLDYGFVEAFAVYLADDASGSNELFVASTTSSHSQLTVPAGTLAGGRSFVLVYCENALGRATSAASVAFSDWALSAPSTTRMFSSATTTS